MTEICLTTKEVINGLVHNICTVGTLKMFLYVCMYLLQELIDLIYQLATIFALTYSSEVYCFMDKYLIPHTADKQILISGQYTYWGLLDLTTNPNKNN